MRDIDNRARFGGLVEVCLGAAALLAELAALAASCRAAWYPALLWHAVACALVGYRSRPRARSFVACSLAACLPVAGVAGVLLVLVPLWRRRLEPAVSVVELELAPAAVPAQDAIELLFEPANSLEQAARKLRALRRVPARFALPHWRDALRDPQDELRLLAHALLDQRERRRHAGAERVRTLRSASASDAELWQALRAHAFACWALDPRGVALDELTCSAEAAFAIQPEAQLCLLLCRARLRAADGGVARLWLQRAVELGVAADSCAELHAEVAFASGDVAGVSSWLRRTRRHELRLVRAAAFWTRRA